MFASKLARFLNRNTSTLQELGVSKRNFTNNNWRQFETVLESMVPYRREALLRSLSVQNESPYAAARMDPVR